MEDPSTPWAQTEILADYGPFDLEALWRGRETQTRLERTVLTTFLEHSDTRRVLELGVGMGRLSPAFRGKAQEYIGVDLVLDHLRRSRDRVRTEVGVEDGCLWIQADLRYLPLAIASVTTVAAIRVLHHFRDLTGILRAFADRLSVGGDALASYAPRPSWGTFLQDVKRSGGFPPTGPSPRVTFARPGVVQAATHPLPVYTSDRRSFSRALASAGFSSHEEVGLPESVPRWARSWALPFGSRFPRCLLLSQFFVHATKGTRDHAAIPELPGALACPVCYRVAEDLPSFRGSWYHACPRCGFGFRFEDGILRAVPTKPAPRDSARAP